MAGISEARSVNMKQFKGLLTVVSPDVAVCVRGRHAVGKSEGVYQAAWDLKNERYKDPELCARLIAAVGGEIKTPEGQKTEWKYEYGTPVVERRLSQMTEGDIIGLPFQHGEDKFDEKTGARIGFSSTQFKPCDWLITAATFPVVLFLDERNRALDGVKQAVFQLTDSKAFYGVHLDKETRIVIAENVGDDYQVQSCDPAEVSRCATVVLQPSKEDFLSYIKVKSHPILHEFLTAHQHLIEFEGQFEPNKKYADRRSWFKLDKEFQLLGWYNEGPENMMHVVAAAFVGTDAGPAFVNYVREYTRHVSAEDILKDWEKAKKRLKGKGDISAETYLECQTKLDTWLGKNELDGDQAYEVARFCFDANAEARMSTFASLQGNMKNLLKVHPYVKQLIVHTTGTEVDETKLVLPPKATSTDGSKTKSSTSKRGGKK